MKEQLQETTEKSKLRENAILRKGRLENSIAGLQAKIKGWK